VIPLPILPAVVDTRDPRLFGVIWLRAEEDSSTQPDHNQLSDVFAVSPRSRTARSRPLSLDPLRNQVLDGVEAMDDRFAVSQCPDKFMVGQDLDGLADG
jgi:hypothetical protein